MAKKVREKQPKTTAQQLGSVIKSARDIMRKDLNRDLDRLPLLTWIMFLKILDDGQQAKGSRAKPRDVDKWVGTLYRLQVLLYAA